MSNSINPFVDGGLHRMAERRPADVGEDAGAKTTTAEAKNAADLLNLTGRAQELQSLQQELAKSPEFDSAKVSELKSVIANGQYEINAERIAEKLLAVESKLP